MFLTADSRREDTTILLDTQSSIHLISSSAIAIDIRNAESPVTVQGITGEKIRINKLATIKDMGIQDYYSPSMKANIISYHKLKETHSVHYDEDTETFIAVPRSGATLTFVCIRGHYTMDINNVVPVYMTHSPSKYSVRQPASARKAYEFIKRMRFKSYKGAAEIIQRGSMKDLNFTRSDLMLKTYTELQLLTRWVKGLKR